MMIRLWVSALFISTIHCEEIDSYKLSDLFGNIFFCGKYCTSDPVKLEPTRAAITFGRSEAVLPVELSIFSIDMAQIDGPICYNCKRLRPKVKKQLKFPPGSVHR